MFDYVGKCMSTNAFDFGVTKQFKNKRNVYIKRKEVVGSEFAFGIYYFVLRYTTI